MRSATLEKVQEDVANLTSADKAALLDFLLVKIESEVSPEIDALWRIEIKRRVTEMDSGKDLGVSWDTVQANAKKKFGFS